MRRPFIITFEGIEGSGKTTQFQRFVKRLRKNGLSVVALREPGSTKLGEKIREILLHSGYEITPLAEALLFCAARVQMIEEKILPIRKKVDLVIIDRFFDSTLAYQGSRGMPGIKYDDFEKMVIFLSLGITPDLTFVFDVSPEVSLKRKTDEDRFFRKNIEFHRRVRSFYKKLSRKFSSRIVVVDSSRSLDDISKELWEIFHKRCPRKFLNYIQ